MLKHLAALLLLSVIVILIMAPAQQALNLLVSAQHWIAQSLMQVFSGGDAGNLIRKLIALLCIPFIVGLVPAIIYWLTKKKWFQYFMELVWITWLIQAAALIILYKP